MEDLQKFKQYVKENGAWVCNCKSPYFQTNEEIKCLMCHSIKNVLLIFQEKKFFFWLFKQAFEKYRYEFNFIDRYFHLR